MKKTWKVFLTLVTALVAVVLVACGQGTASKDNKEAEVKKIDFILDWTPNTNHTGLYVAKEKGYFKEAGVDVDLKLPPEESSSDLVINGKAPFAIYFQDYMAKKLEKGARIKLATELSRRGTGKTVYILDEPTTGLHFADVHKLVEILRRLSEGGNTVIVIEHNLDVIKTADYIIDIGPEGGDGGGQVIACGTPEEIVKVKESYTGRYLKRYI